MGKWEWDTQTIVAVYTIYLANVDGVYDDPTSIAALNNNLPTIGRGNGPNRIWVDRGFSPMNCNSVLKFAKDTFPEFCRYDRKGWSHEEVEAAARFLYRGGLYKMNLVCEAKPSLEVLEDVKLAVFAAAVAEMERVEGRTLGRRASFERKRPSFTWNNHVG